MRITLEEAKQITNGTSETTPDLIKSWFEDENLEPVGFTPQDLADIINSKRSETLSALLPQRIASKIRSIAAEKDMTISQYLQKAVLGYWTTQAEVGRG